MRGPVPVVAPVQGSFDELGTPLREVTFVVVDLETTGGSPATAEVTEVGAVKVRGGEVLGEFATLVNPGSAIPPFIAVLTGITDAMVAAAPRLSAVLPTFLEFARGSVLVAHNSPFDLGFLRAGCALLGLTWPGFDSIDTARLARRVLTRDEAPDCKLASLARVFRTATSPTHRALADARATVEVLHALLERLGPLGVGSLEELETFSSRVTPEQRRKRHLAEPLPHAPGVYLFRDARGRALYIGKASDLRARVRHYFVASEERSRMAEMVAASERVDYVVCAHPLEAEVRELRLIAEYKPRFNRRSRFPERTSWLKLTVEPFPRLALVRAVHDDTATYLGPFGSRRSAELVRHALHEATRLRQCSARLSPRRRSSACALAEMGRCGAPCDGRQDVASYASIVEDVRAAVHGDPRRLTDRLLARITALAAAQRFEEAAAHRDRLAALVRATARQQRLVALANCPLLVAARPRDGGWELSVLRHGRLAAAGYAPPGAPPRPHVEALLATAETVFPGPGPTPCASAAEMECALRWLEGPGTRLVELTGSWSCPAYGAGGLRDLLAAAEDRHGGLAVGADRPGLRPVHRPAR